MDVADRYLGSREDEAVADRLDDEGYRTVALSDTDRRRSRVRTETIEGRELGIVIGRELEDGDVLETESGDLILVELVSMEALVLDLSTVDSPTAALELGHAIGNRHWKLALRGTDAVVPTTESRERMEGLVGEWLPEASYRYEAVPPTLFDDGGGAASYGDGHGHGTGHSHTHPHSHGHEHSHSRSPPLSLDPSGGDDGDDR